MDKKNSSCVAVPFFHFHATPVIQPFTTFDIGEHEQLEYFDIGMQRLLLERLVKEKYQPLVDYLIKNKKASCMLDISGSTLLDLLENFDSLVADLQILHEEGRVSFVCSTMYNSPGLSFDSSEFVAQVTEHKHLLEQTFGSVSTFAYPGFTYDTKIGAAVSQLGFTDIIALYDSTALGAASPDNIYASKASPNLRVHFFDTLAASNLVENSQHWNPKPYALTFFDVHHYDVDTVIAAFEELIADVSVSLLDAKAEQKTVPINMPQADEKQVGGLIGDGMQQRACSTLYGLRDAVMNSGDTALIENWKKLTDISIIEAMCPHRFEQDHRPSGITAYETPYDTHIYFMNILQDIAARLEPSKVTAAGEEKSVKV